MKDLLLVVSAILMLFAFKIIQVSKNTKQQFNRMDKRYKQFLRYKAKEKQHTHS